MHYPLCYAGVSAKGVEPPPHSNARYCTLYPLSYANVVPAEGFEPPTFSSVARRSIR